MLKEKCSFSVPNVIGAKQLGVSLLEPNMDT